MVVIPNTLELPVRLTLGFTERGGVIVDTLGLYRLEGTTWLTSDIAVVERTGSHLVAWIGRAGIYGLLGRTNRFYLPIVFRTGD